MNLLEQFQRLANFYFLCLLLLQLIPAISSLTPVTTAMPLIGVLMMTAVKDAYDDFVSLSLPSMMSNQYALENYYYFYYILQQRHMSDSQVNNRRSKTLRKGKLIEEKWSDVQVGWE